MYNTRLNQIADSRCPSHSGILMDVCKGVKWIDQSKNGDSILAVTYSYCVDGCGLFGEMIPSKEAEEFLQEVFTDLKKKGMNAFEFSCEDEELTKWLLGLFPEKKIQSEMEISYRYYIKDNTLDFSHENLGNIDSQEKRDDQEYKVIPIDSKFLDDISIYENNDFLMDRLTNSWEISSFMKESVGFVAVAFNRIIGIIFGSGKYQEFLAIDIEVEADFRRKGIADHLTKCFVKTCQKRSIIPQWDCVESNITSQRLAEKNGFERMKMRPFYWFEI